MIIHLCDITDKFEPSIKQATNQSSNQPIDQSINQSLDQPINESVDQSICLAVTDYITMKVLCVLLALVALTCATTCGDLQRLKVKLQWTKAYGNSHERTEFSEALWQSWVKLVWCREWDFYNVESEPLIISICENADSAPRAYGAVSVSKTQFPI